MILKSLNNNLKYKIPPYLKITEIQATSQTIPKPNTDTLTPNTFILLSR